MHHVVGDGVYARQVGDLHVDLGGLLRGLDEAEGLVQVLARSVDAMETPNHETRGEHLLCGGFSDFIGAAEHPGQHVHAVWEDYDALGAHLPKGSGELPLVQRVDVGHGQQVRRVAVHDHAVFRVGLEAGYMAHHVCRKLTGELAAVREAPEELRSLTAVGETHKTQVHIRRILHVLEILAGAGDQEVLALQRGSGETGGNGTQDSVAIQIFLDLCLIQQQAAFMDAEE